MNKQKITFRNRINTHYAEAISYLNTGSPAFIFRTGKWPLALAVAIFKSASEHFEDSRKKNQSDLNK